MMVAEHVASGGPDGRMTEAFAARLDRDPYAWLRDDAEHGTAGVTNPVRPDRQQVLQWW